MTSAKAEALRLWRWVIAVLAVAVVCVLLAWLLSAKVTSISAQLFGSLLTLFGLLFAYLQVSNRGKTVPAQLREFFLTLIGRHQPNVHSIECAATVTASCSVDLQVVLRDLRELPVQEQIDKLAHYIRNHVTEDHGQLLHRLKELQSVVEKAHSAAFEQSKMAYKKSSDDLQQFGREQDQQQVLELRWAIFGIYIMTIGTVLSYWA